MKTKLMSLAAAAAISLGGAAFAGSASAITPAAVAGTTAPALALNAGGGIELARYGRGYRGYRHARHYRMCRRLYVRGFHYGNWQARRAWYRNCSRRWR